MFTTTCTQITFLASDNSNFKWKNWTHFCGKSEGLCEHVQANNERSEHRVPKRVTKCGAIIDRITLVPICLEHVLQ